MDNFEANCVTIGEIVTLLGQSWIFQGNLGHCWAIVAVLEGFNILICTGIYAFGYKGFNDFVIQASMLSYIQTSMTLYMQAEMLSYIQASMTLCIGAEMLSYIQA